MKDEDIIGKEFTAVYFEKDGLLTYNDSYDRFIGKTGIVTNTHVDYPQFARVEFDKSGYLDALHWPVKVIKEQLQLNAFKETPEYTKSLFKEILNLTKIK